MGKKEKKDNKPAPVDIFDPLNIESHQAFTAVLLLDSAEEDVLGRACEAVYKFADKCDDNKRNLLEMGLVPPLLKLILHDDRVVKKNSTAAIGVLTHASEVRRELRKIDSFIPNVISLLAPTEEHVIQEFAALALAEMAQEYSSKSAILDNGGMEPLIRCLSSSDPDIQKNSVQCIALILMDFKGRLIFRDLEGLPVVVSLLSSEYAIIQQLAILVLDRASQEGESRSVLCDLGVVPKLIDLVGQKEWRDLHVPSVQVLSHLLEETSTLIQIRDTGGLKKLVSYITDQPVPEEENKKDKKAIKSGKKSAKSESKKKEEEKDIQEHITILPTLPDVKICACHAIACAGQNTENKRLLHEMEVEKMLIYLLSHENYEVQAAAATALGVMADYIISRDTIRELDGIPLLTKLLNSDHPNIKEAATYVLAVLTTSNNKNCLELESGAAVDNLITLLGDNCLSAVANSATVLMNMASDEGLRSLIQSKGIVEALLAPLNLPYGEVQSTIALTLAAFCCDADARSELLVAGGLEILVPLLESNNDMLRSNVCWAISVCAVDEAIATEVCRLGGMAMLQKIQSSSTKRNVLAKAALNKLLDNALSAKFALTGYLSPLDVIPDEFFDAGQLRPDAQFVTLDEYLLQEVTDRRAIITINGKLPECPSASTYLAEEDPRTEPSKNSTSGKTSRLGRESRTKTKAQREKEEKAREELLLLREQQALARKRTCPPDAELSKYIDEVQEKIEPLLSIQQQAIELAKFVSLKMGGAIEKEALSSFSWELPLSEIMYDNKSNVVPIGKITHGIHIHRALLFKALADRIALPCSLVRGEYNRAWNVMMLPDETDTEIPQEYPSRRYVVDLIYEPGRLMLEDTAPAVTYTKL